MTSSGKGAWYQNVLPFGGAREGREGPQARVDVAGDFPGIVDMSRVIVKHDQWGGAGAFARVPIKKGELVERGIVRELPVDGNDCPFVFTWSESEPRRWASGS